MRICAAVQLDLDEAGIHSKQLVRYESLTMQLLSLSCLLSSWGSIATLYKVIPPYANNF